MHLRLMLAAVGCLVVVFNAHGHGGGLNAEGCHNNRKHGGYHCHRAPAIAPRPCGYAWYVVIVQGHLAGPR